MPYLLTHTEKEIGMYQEIQGYSGNLFFAKGGKGGGRGLSSHPGPGGNWPSTTDRPSGGNRGNAK